LPRLTDLAAAEDRPRPLAAPWVDLVEGDGRTEIWIAGANASIYLRKRAAAFRPWERQAS